MSSREKILANIRQNRTKQEVILPTNIDFENTVGDKTDKFIAILKGIGGEAVEADLDFIKKDIDEHFPSHLKIINLSPNVHIKSENIEQITDAHDLAFVDLAILEGLMGVAENGAIWLDETCFGGHRVLPFITQHLIIILNKENIVANMHKAYNKLEINKIGFGLFLAGPSKTADIEQSLVIGAHGARSLKVYLI
jgi:L-lactate dehydrogenase complex protein LldG